MAKPVRIRKVWAYQNTGLLVASIVALMYFANTHNVHALLAYVDGFGYLTAFIAGALFVSTFTVVPAGIVLFHIAQNFEPISLTIIAACGGAIGDLVIFRFLKDGVFEELAPLFNRFGNRCMYPLMCTPYFVWIYPVIGGLIIASPLPDEVGIGLMGLSNLRPWQFLLVSFLFNVIGIIAIVWAAKTF